MLDAEYIEVIPGLWQGALPLVHQTTYYDGFDVIVMCSDERYAATVSFLPETTDKQVVVKFHDGMLKDLAHMEALYESALHVATCIRENGCRALVLCSSGIYRSGAFSAVVLYHLGFSISDAIDHVTRIRYFEGGHTALLRQVEDYLQGRGLRV